MYHYRVHVGYFPPRTEFNVAAKDYESAKSKIRQEMDRENALAGIESPVGYDLFLIETDDPAFDDSPSITLEE